MRATHRMVGLVGPAVLSYIGNTSALHAGKKGSNPLRTETLILIKIYCLHGIVATHDSCKVGSGVRFSLKACHVHVMYNKYGKRNG